MYVDITFKTPGVIDETIDEFRSSGAGEEALADARKVLSKYIKFGEYITVRFSLTTGNATVMIGG